MNTISNHTFVTSLDRIVLVAIFTHVAIFCILLCKHRPASTVVYTAMVPLMVSAGVSILASTTALIHLGAFLLRVSGPHLVNFAVCFITLAIVLKCLETKQASD